MKFGLKSLLLVLAILFAPAAFADSPPANPPTPPANNPPSPDPKAPITLSREDLEKIVADAVAKAKGDGDKKKDDSDTDPLRDKVKKDREAAEKAQADAKTLEQVVSFNLGLDDFVAKNKDLLPSEIPELVKAAAGERYETAGEKAAAIKKAIVESYFSVQANVDCLTESQKRDLDDYQRLTTKGRADRAAAIYATLFEPTLEMNRRIKKAEELARGRSGVNPNGATEAYHQKLIAASNGKYAHKQ